MKDNQKPISARKLAANRANAARSTGPRTPQGKKRSSENGYRHGLFSNRLFLNEKMRALDGADYDTLVSVFRNHYEPVGDLEHLCVEQIAVNHLRLARLLSHEQKVMSWTSPFEEKSVDKLLRYESSLSRRLLKEIERLERLQEQRMETLDDVECDDKADAGATELGAAEVIGGEPCDNDFVTNNCFIDGSKHEKLIEDILADGDSEPFE